MHVYPCVPMPVHACVWSGVAWNAPYPGMHTGEFVHPSPPSTFRIFIFSTTDNYGSSPRPAKARYRRSGPVTAPLNFLTGRHNLLIRPSSPIARRTSSALKPLDRLTAERQSYLPKHPESCITSQISLSKNCRHYATATTATQNRNNCGVL